MVETFESTKRRKKNKCTYALCYACKSAEDEEAHARQGTNNAKRQYTCFDHTDELQERQLHDKMNNKYDNDHRLDPEALKYSCHHNDRRTLIPFTESDYFTTTYQEKIKFDNISFPIKCDECRLRLKG